MKLLVLGDLFQRRSTLSEAHQTANSHCPPSYHRPWPHKEQLELACPAQFQGRGSTWVSGPELLSVVAPQSGWMWVLASAEQWRWARPPGSPVLRLWLRQEPEH